MHVKSTIRILKTMVLVLGLRTNMWDPYVYDLSAVFAAFKEQFLPWLLCD